jgi:hypothetical protein
MGTDQGGDLSAIENGPVRLTYGGAVFGFTMEGVETEYVPSWNVLAVDQFGPETKADLMLNGQQFNIIARIPEFTFTKIRDLFPGSILSTSGPDQVVTVGRAAGLRASTVAKQLILHPIALDLADLSRDVTVHLALVEEGPTSEFQPAEALMREVTFVSLIDDSKADGNKLFAIGVPTVGVDVTPPTVSSRNITDTDVGVAKTISMEWTMDENMDADSINTDNVLMLKDGIDEVAGVVSYDDSLKKITFNPTSDLDGTTAYTAVLGTGVKDRALNKLATKDIVNFTTAA